ncbi:hypothetical protein VNO80_14297 [Phaseolus coccineus]|uniref:Uncharacterized protein n=1 Tax=Phaseolus coccineus TaxID=3886 RepID=A0AAN9R0S0_PHACN
MSVICWLIGETWIYDVTYEHILIRMVLLGVHSVRGTPLDDNLVHNILLQVFSRFMQCLFKISYLTNYTFLCYSVTHSNLHRGRDGPASALCLPCPFFSTVDPS